MLLTSASSLTFLNLLMLAVVLKARSNESPESVQNCHNYTIKLQQLRKKNLERQRRVLTQRVSHNRFSHCGRWHQHACFIILHEHTLVLPGALAPLSIHLISICTLQTLHRACSPGCRPSAVPCAPTRLPVRAWLQLHGNFRRVQLVMCHSFAHCCMVDP